MSLCRVSRGAGVIACVSVVLAGVLKNIQWTNEASMS